MEDGVRAEYAGEHDHAPYTVQVLSSGGLHPLANRQERVVLRIRFREVTRDVIAIVGSRGGEALVHAAVHRRLDAGWPA
jgi:hypothetical protein